MVQPIALIPGSLALCLALAPNDVELNRLVLSNGPDILWFINDPYIGSDPANGNYSGDFYWKVYPKEATRTCEGAATLWGVEMNLFDLDWTNSAPLWAYQITTASPGTDLNLEPLLSTSAPGVFVPEIPNSGFTQPLFFDCPPDLPLHPGYLSGWLLHDLFADTATGSLIPLMQASDALSADYFRADGTVDWAFVHFYPGDKQTDGGQSHSALNNCGDEGTASFQWAGSANLGGGWKGGENQASATLRPDGNHTGGTQAGSVSRYGGFQSGLGNGPANGLIPDLQDYGSDLAFLFDGMQLNLAVNTQYAMYGVIEPEIGLAGLQLPIGWSTETNAPSLKDADTIPGATAVTLGCVLYNQSASTNGTSLGAFAANVDMPGGALDLLIDHGACTSFLGGDFALNPANPLFVPIFATSLQAGLGFAPQEPRDWQGHQLHTTRKVVDSVALDIAYHSPQYPVPHDPSLLGITIAFQGWEFDLLGVPGSEIADSSQVLMTTLRSNTNVE